MDNRDMISNAMLYLGDWLSIESAPKDGATIFLRNSTYSDVGALWNWNRNTKRWETRILGIMGLTNARWDETKTQPTHWKPLYAHQVAQL